MRNGILIYSHVVSNHPRETLYRSFDSLVLFLDNAVYNMTLDYYSYYLQHVIHIQVLQYSMFLQLHCRKKGIFSKVLPRVFRLFVDGVSFDILPMFFQQDQQDGSCSYCHICEIEVLRAHHQYPSLLLYLMNGFTPGQEVEKLFLGITQESD